MLFSVSHGALMMRPIYGKHDMARTFSLCMLHGRGAAEYFALKFY